MRAKAGFVLQNTVLFAGSIRDNIAYGRLDAEKLVLRADHEHAKKHPHKHAGKRDN